jgi:mannose-6-phosphate isomerase-like protein (cupin superfamily)
MMRIEDVAMKIMPPNRGKTLRLVDAADGAKNVDVHINLLNARSGTGPTHYQAKAENIYVVLEGFLDVIIEGKEYRLNPGEMELRTPPAITAMPLSVCSKSTPRRGRISI